MDSFGLIAATVIAVIAHSAAFYIEYLIPERGPPTDLVTVIAIHGRMGSEVLINLFIDETDPAGKDAAGSGQAEHKQNEAGKGRFFRFR